MIKTSNADLEMKSLEDYETWTDCPNENTYFVKNLFEEKNDKFCHTHRLSTRDTNEQH
jgi:hypothetical protein